MNMSDPDQLPLARRSCRPCTGDTPRLTREEAEAMLGQVPGWELAGDGSRLRRRWVARNFNAGISFFNRIAELAEEQGHHPDLHLEGYRNVTVELWTHAIGGLSLNDFILAARIDALPIELKRSFTKPKGHR
jgi:4a-hydroxytetrahydrobiopterin dehydratase